MDRILVLDMRPPETAFGAGSGEYGLLGSHDARWES
jgi:hypothetical protein